jgi:hypothetical protein
VDRLDAPLSSKSDSKESTLLDVVPSNRFPVEKEEVAFDVAILGEGALKRAMCLMYGFLDHMDAESKIDPMRITDEKVRQLLHKCKEVTDG